MILPIDPTIHQQLVQVVEKCGVLAADLQITYEDDLQSELILVKAKTATDEQLRCIAEAQSVAPYPIVLFEDPTLAKRSSEIEHQKDRAAAREWLRGSSLLASLPNYDPKRESVSNFAGRLESFCGIEPGSVLALHGIGMLTIKEEWAEASLKRPSSRFAQDKFACLRNAISASNLEEHGVNFGFVGNEQYSDKQAGD